MQSLYQYGDDMSIRNENEVARARTWQAKMDFAGKINMEPPEEYAEAILEMREALASMCDAEREVADNSFGAGGARPCTDGEWADSDPTGFARYQRARAILSRITTGEAGDAG